MPADKGYRVEYVPLAEIQRWPRNPKAHAEKDLDDSLERFGFVAPLVLDESSGRLVAGHGRLEALLRRREAGKAPPERVAIKGKEWLVPVVRGVSFKDTAEAEVYLLADNRLTEAGGWDEGALSEMLSRLGNSAAGLSGVGYDFGDVEALAKRATESMASVGSELPAGPSAPGMFQTQEIKQVVLRYEGAAYDSLVAKLASLMVELKLNSHTEVVQRLLAEFEGA